MDFLIALYLILFPFGKLTWLVPDILVFVIVLKGSFDSRSSLRMTAGINFLIICLFSLLFSLSFFKLPQIFIGILYFIRLISYVIFARIVYEKFGKNKEKRKLIFDSLILIGIFIAVFGWIQYLAFPDVRFLKMLGWDDHYFRLVSTFLDPAFTGILLVLAECLVLVKSIHKITRYNLVLNLFLIFTILFTYSRASYLALFVVFVFLFAKFRKKVVFLLLLFFLILIPILPKASSEGTNLARTYSVNQKFINYDQSLNLIKKSPVFGIGFDNICVATTKNFNSHSCSGLDNSVLFIIATTGIAGLIVFTDSIFRIVKNRTQDMYGNALIVSFLAVFIHGMFTETFFYNFILGWIAILIGISRKRIKD